MTSSRRFPFSRPFPLALPRGAFLPLVLALLLAIQASPARAGLFNPTTFTLENGMEVVVVQDHRAPVVTHMVWYKVGAADEPPAKSGIAHVLEHLMFKGTEKVGPGEFSKIVARNGGRDNAFTSLDYTAYFQNVAANKLDLVMGLEADRMVNLRLKQETVEPEVRVVVEERLQRTDNEPAALMSEQMSAAQYLSHPYGIPVIGWRHEVEKLNAADALDFYRRHYAPNNAILVVAGDVEPDEVKRLAEKHFGPIPARELAPRLRSQEPPQLAARRVEMRNGRVSQPSWRRSYLAPSATAGKTEEALPLTVLAEILGGGSTGRFYRKLVVEQAVAAGAGAWYNDVSRDMTTFTLYATPGPGGDLERIETAMDQVLAEVLEKGVTEEEFERAKRGLLAEAVYARDSLSGAARLFGSALAVGMTVEQIESWPERIAAVTIDQVNAAARQVFRLERSVTGRLLPKSSS